MCLADEGDGVSDGKILNGAYMGGDNSGNCIRHLCPYRIRWKTDHGNSVLGGLVFY